MVQPTHKDITQAIEQIRNESGIVGAKTVVNDVKNVTAQIVQQYASDKESAKDNMEQLTKIDPVIAQLVTKDLTDTIGKDPSRQQDFTDLKLAAKAGDLKRQVDLLAMQYDSNSPSAETTPQSAAAADALLLLNGDNKTPKGLVPAELRAVADGSDKIKALAGWIESVSSHELQTPGSGGVQPKLAAQSF